MPLKQGGACQGNNPRQSRGLSNCEPLKAAGGALTRFPWWCHLKVAGLSQQLQLIQSIILLFLIANVLRITASSRPTVDTK